MINMEVDFARAAADVYMFGGYKISHVIALFISTLSTLSLFNHNYVLFPELEHSPCVGIIPVPFRGFFDFIPGKLNNAVHRMYLISS